ncbi:MAG: sporulation transcriptional regulator SpoIIID [Oscillospiraceae bacterium]|nr:sporulation transcriptional regulator SpoIIID [Oscillospiraceae bacterium]
MKGFPEERTILAAEYIIENGATVRSAAKKFGVSKSTVHKDVSERLRRLNPNLYLQVKEVLEKNKSERHIRGGIATREKYAGLRHF